MEILDLLNLWMTTLIPPVTEILKRAFPVITPRTATIIVLILFLGIFLVLDATAVELFVSIVTALASYDLIWKPAVFTPMLGKHKRMF